MAQKEGVLQTREPQAEIIIKAISGLFGCLMQRKALTNCLVGGPNISTKSKSKQMDRIRETTLVDCSGATDFRLV